MYSSTFIIYFYYCKVNCLYVRSAHCSKAPHSWYSLDLRNGECHRSKQQLVFPQDGKKNVFLVWLKPFLSHFTRPQHPSRPFFQFLLLFFQLSVAACHLSSPLIVHLGWASPSELQGRHSRGDPGGHALLPPWEASSQPPQHRAETQMAAGGWRAPLQPRQMRALHFVSDTHTHTSGCAGDKRLSTNKEKQIRHLNLNTCL